MSSLLHGARVLWVKLGPPTQVLVHRRRGRRAADAKRDMILSGFG